MAQAVSLRPLTGKAGFDSRSVHKIYGGQSLRQIFLRVLGVFPCQGRLSLPEEHTRETWETALSEKECTG
jgi:hypothetical protein